MGLVGCSDASESSEPIDSAKDSALASTADDQSEIVQRFVTLSPAIGVMLRDLGFEDSIVGRHSYDMALSKTIPAVGSHIDIDYELLISLEPTAIYIERTSVAIPGKLMELADEFGWRVISYELKTLDDIAMTLDDLYLKLVGFGDEPKTADEMFNFDIDPTKKFDMDFPSARLASAWSPMGAAASKAGRVLVLAGIDPPGAMGPGSFHGQLIERMGLTPAIVEGGMWQEFDHEDLINLAPNSILVFAPESESNDPNAFDPNALIGEPTAMGWDEIVERLGSIADLPIPAIEHRRVAIVTHPLGLLPSSSFGQVADEVRRAVEGWGE